MWTRLRQRLSRWTRRREEGSDSFDPIESGTYRRRYLEYLATRCAEDAKQAVGGRWDEIGPYQLDFLREAGLEPHHHLLDIGCGSLRAGLHLIRYLEPGHYVGLDISPDLLAAAERHLREAGLSERLPELRRVVRLDFAELAGRRFDYLLAHSVLTHMPEAEIEELFDHLPRAMRPGGVFYATFHDRKRRKGAPRPFNFFHYFDHLRELGEWRGLTVEHEPRFVHPRGQQMLRITR